MHFQDLAWAWLLEVVINLVHETSYIPSVKNMECFSPEKIREKMEKEMKEENK